MKSMFGITNLQMKQIGGKREEIEVKVNDFLVKHNGDVVDIAFCQGVHDWIDVYIVYQECEKL